MTKQQQTTRDQAIAERARAALADSAPQHVPGNADLTCEGFRVEEDEPGVF